MPDVLCDYLQDYRQKSGKGTMLVVLSAQGKPMTESAWKRMIESYLTQLNYTYGVFKDKKHITIPSFKNLCVYGLEQLDKYKDYEISDGRFVIRPERPEHPMKSTYYSPTV